MLLRERKDGKLPKGAVQKVADYFSISTRSVSRLNQHAISITTKGSLPDLSCNLVKKVGRKRIELDFDRMKEIPFSRRTNIRSLSSELKYPKSTVHQRIKEGYIRPHSNSLKPYLSEENVKSRLEFCLSMIDKDSIDTSPKFINMYDQIHIDEKWYYMSKTTQKYYLLPDESEPFRTCKSKRFIPKIMFLAAVARPYTDVDTGATFDEKIGIWPFVCKETARIE
ncbi:uncharacterized protein LOC126687538 [Mercurialis annua]|uniref:uncharacterized protein LOC126687538 n=1 Tax=Mercurialis annua TaxID=3986 RepID=UPI00215FBE16|nr:uncharacterized protein LOC126687538 [Mercurialis annua]